VTTDGLVTRPGHAWSDLCEPPAPGSATGRLVVAWQNPGSRLISPVGFLEHGDGYCFRYLKAAENVPGFAPFLSFPDLRRVYRSEHLFPLFSQRVMNPRRADFREFLRQLHLSVDASPWEQLARSGGRRTGDTIQVFPVPSVEPDGTTTCLFLVHGIRHMTHGGLPDLSPGDRLVLRDEPTNEVNPDAVLVCGPSGAPVGHVPDLLLEHLRTVQRSGPIAVTVEHINGPEAPPHLRLLVRLSGRAAPNYRPMTGPRWETYS
jgi:hypothetical protein